jgi:aspartate 4-decarboxylase
VALAHTGGLSTPQQIIMLLFSVFELLDRNNAYKKAIMDLLRGRWQALFKELHLPAPDSPLLTRYYALLDIRDLAERRHGREAAQALVRKPFLEFLIKLADERQTVCLPGEGFAGPAWSLRVALANLSEEDCRRAGKNIVETIDRYVKDAV